MDHDETQPGPRDHAGRCANCDAALAHDQRYCVSCGTRRGPLPPVVDGTLRGLRAPEMPSALVPVTTVDEDGEEPDEPLSSSPGWLPAISLPTPRVASLAVMAMLSFGVVAGSLTAPGGIDALARTFVVSVSPSSPPPTPLADTGSGGGGSNPAPATQQTITITSPAPSTPAGGSTGGGGITSNAGSGGGSGSAAVTLPPIKHVFMIMLSSQGYNQAFGTSTGHPYLAKTLRAQGELLPDYYGVASSPLANEIALFSGQGPTNQTAADCPQYTPITPGTTGPHGQVQGDGCVYPKTTPTLPDELVANGYTWKAYLQGSAQAPAGQPTTCRHPAAGATDPNTNPQSGDPYVTWRNPFVYFDSIASSPLCATDDVDLSALSKDLKSVSTTPNVSYIAADPCADGADQPCAPGSPSGLAAADTFLKTVVPEIERSAAYKADGMIVITFDQAPQSGPNADNSSCCDQPTFPNLGAGASPTSTTGTSTTPTTTSGTTTGTTSTGTSTSGTTSTATTSTGTTSTGTTTPGTPTDTTSTSSTAPGPVPGTTTTDTTSTSTGSTTPTTTSGTTSTGTTGAGACPPPAAAGTTPTGTTTTGTTTTATTTTGTTTSGTTPTTGTTTTTGTSTTTGSTTGTPCGGGQVGALLISKYVTPGSSDVVGQFNHFSLLKTIEDLFSVTQLGYSKDAALPEFDSSTFNASTSG